jgi:two-component system sensor kinase FixL
VKAMAGVASLDPMAYVDAILETLSDGLVILDANFQLVEINDAGLAMAGARSLDDLIGLQALSLVCPDSISAIYDHYKATLVGGANQAKHVTVNMAGIDGVNRVLECRMARLRSNSGGIDGVLIRTSDVTLREQLLVAADESAALLQAILATVPDAMIVIDEQGVITTFSAVAEELFGYSEAEVIGQNVKILMPDPDRAAHDGYIANYLRTGEGRIMGSGRVVEAMRRDGSIFPMELTLGEARSGAHRAFTGFVRDLTDRMATEAQLHRLQSELAHASRLSAVGTLASALAHEINQPLTAIANFLSVGQVLPDGESAESWKIVREAMDCAASEALRAGQIVRRLREFVSKGELDLQVQPLAQLVNEAMTLGLVGARERGVKWEIAIEPDMDDVFADRIQIQQVLVNLMRNAIEAMEASPVKNIIIRACPAEEGQVEISVSDSGSGITPEVAATLFQPFTSTKGDGMGLGLSICRTIVEAHGGKLRIEPNENGGTRFSFTLMSASRELQHDAF